MWPFIECCFVIPNVAFPQALILFLGVKLYMSCGLLTEANELVQLVQEYIRHYKDCAASREQCVLEKLEQTIVQECQNRDAMEKV